MHYAIVSVAAAPVRRKPDHRKEMVNQLLFGESVRILKTKGELWVKIQSLHDGYTGWMTQTMLQPIDEDAANTMGVFTASDILSQILIGDKQRQVPVGSSLPFFESLSAGGQNGKGKLGEVEYHFTGHYLKRDEQAPSDELITQLAMPWLNAPYL